MATPSAAPSGDEEIASFLSMEINLGQSELGASVKVRMEDGIAILSGTATSLGQVERAAMSAITTQGVRGVVNEVKIKSSPDVESLATKALAGQRMLNTDGVIISERGGRLQLTGHVSSRDEMELVRQIVADVRGVSAIDNDLAIVADRAGRSDSEIAAQIRFLIARDPAFQGLDVAVNVRAGSVGMNGEVGSSGEIGRLTKLSRVEGVTAFRTSGLKVNSDLAMEAFENKDYSRQQALNAFSAAIRTDKRIDSEAIQASLQDNVMTLSGSVEKLTARDSAEFSARLTPGVTSVVNELTVEPQIQLLSKFTASSDARVLPPH